MHRFLHLHYHHPAQHVSLWMNVKRDDSYTPTKISVKAGTGWHDMTEVRYR
jgi:anaphase-promoting complex subunit 10